MAQVIDDLTLKGRSSLCQVFGGSCCCGSSHSGEQGNIIKSHIAKYIPSLDQTTGKV
jgi:hypothetical protein